MELQVGVKVLLQNNEGLFLVLLRSDKYKTVKNKWDIPGGRIDPGSSLMDNLRREVLEETGLEMAIEPSLIAAQDIFAGDQNRHVVRLTYLGKANGEPVLSEEHTDYGWFTLQELQEMEYLDHYLKEVLIDRTIMLLLK